MSGKLLAASLHSMNVSSSVEANRGKTCMTVAC
jgi:hypothetical protein